MTLEIQSGHQTHNLLKQFCNQADMHYGLSGRWRTQLQTGAAAPAFPFQDQRFRTKNWLLLLLVHLSSTTTAAKARHHRVYSTGNQDPLRRSLLNQDPLGQGNLLLRFLSCERSTI